MNTKIRDGIRLARLGLASACVAVVSLTAQAQPVGTNQIAFTDWDNTNPGWSYGYFYQWNDGGARGTYTENRAFTDPLIDPTNGPLVFQYTFDGTAYADAIANSGGGFGTGFGTGMVWDNDWTRFTSFNLADYILSFDVRVEGLKPGQATANCQFEFRLNSNRVDPPLPNNRVLQKNIQFTPGSNWTHYVFSLEEGGFGENTTATTFSNGVYAGITGVEFNQNQHAPDGQFGIDGDNAIYIDNIKLEVIAYAGPPPPPPPKVVAGAVLDWNFDDKPLWWGSGGWNWSQNTFLPTGTYSFGTNAAGDQGAINTEGVGGSSGWVLWVDNSALAAPNTPGWAGIGMNGGGPINNSWFTSSNLTDYVFTFDCRAVGLAEGATSAGSMAAVVLDAPDDTVQPPDADTGNDRLLRLNFVLPAGTNWQTVTYTLKEGSLDAEGGSSFARFNSYFDKINGVMLQWQINDVNSETRWGFDTDNMIAIDNAKLERLVVGCPPLSVGTSGDNVIVSWGVPATGTVKLQSANNVGGPFTEVVGAANPYSTPRASAPRYFRTLWVPPSP